MTPAEQISIIGQLDATVEALGHKFAIHTLDGDAEVLAHAAKTPFGDDEARDRVLMIEKLARAITSVDGVSFALTDEEKSKGMNEVQKARKVIFTWHYPVVKRVYKELLILEEKRNQAVESLEKNAPTPITSTGSTK